ncbi:prepilin peptidase [Patescibacteria group bacterium]|nr:prepilin peptidase [Patescibacteria group bacterium]MBU1931713.1 prepilin peptidase [Patescibacteria group bacterium]
MIYVFLFILGLCFGSFLNVVIFRTTHNYSPFSGRSFCPHCKKKISWQDNIPLLSFFLLKGRCRYCHQSISQSYFLVELLTGIEFVWIWFLIQSNLTLLGQFEGFYSLLYAAYLLYIFYVFLGITVADLKYGLIPDFLVFSGIAVSSLFVLTSYNFLLLDFKSYFISGLGAGGALAALIILTKGKGMGWGDVKLALLMGLFLGWPKIVIAFYVAFLTGAITAVILILLRKKRFGQTLPFGPFLIAGTLAAFFWGEPIWQSVSLILGIK